MGRPAFHHILQLVVRLWCHAQDRWTQGRAWRILDSIKIQFEFYFILPNFTSKIPRVPLFPFSFVSFSINLRDSSLFSDSCCTRGEHVLGEVVPHLTSYMGTLHFSMYTCFIIIIINSLSLPRVFCIVIGSSGHLVSSLGAMWILWKILSHSPRRVRPSQLVHEHRTVHWPVPQLDSVLLYMFWHNYKLLCFCSRTALVWFNFS